MLTLRFSYLIHLRVLPVSLSSRFVPSETRLNCDSAGLLPFFLSFFLSFSTRTKGKPEEAGTGRRGEEEKEKEKGGLIAGKSGPGPRGDLEFCSRSNVEFI